MDFGCAAEVIDYHCRDASASSAVLVPLLIAAAPVREGEPPGMKTYSARKRVGGSGVRNLRRRADRVDDFDASPHLCSADRALRFRLCDENPALARDEHLSRH
jgi:hypothetical protein